MKLILLNNYFKEKHLIIMKEFIIFIAIIKILNLI